MKNRSSLNEKAKSYKINFEYKKNSVTVTSESSDLIGAVKSKALKLLSGVPSNVKLYHNGKDFSNYETEVIGAYFSNPGTVYFKLVDDIKHTMLPSNDQNYYIGGGAKLKKKLFDSEINFNKLEGSMSYQKIQNINNPYKASRLMTTELSDLIRDLKSNTNEVVLYDSSKETIQTQDSRNYCHIKHLPRIDGICRNKNYKDINYFHTKVYRNNILLPLNLKGLLCQKRNLNNDNIADSNSNENEMEEVYRKINNSNNKHSNFNSYLGKIKNINKSEPKYSINKLLFKSLNVEAKQLNKKRDIKCKNCNENLPVSEYCRNCKLFICSKCKQNKLHSKHLTLHLDMNNYFINLEIYSSIIQSDIENNIDKNKKMMDKKELKTNKKNKNPFSRCKEIIQKLTFLSELYESSLKEINKYLAKVKESKIQDFYSSYSCKSTEILEQIEQLMNRLKEAHKPKNDINNSDKEYDDSNIVINFEELKKYFNEMNDIENSISSYTRPLIKLNMIEELKSQMESIYTKIDKIIENASNENSFLNLKDDYNEEFQKMKGMITDSSDDELFNEVTISSKDKDDPYKDNKNKELVKRFMMRVSGKEDFDNQSNEMKNKMKESEKKNSSIKLMNDCIINELNDNDSDCM